MDKRNLAIKINKLKLVFRVFRGRYKNWLRYSRYLGIVSSLVFVSVVFSLLTPIFLTKNNFVNIAQQSTINTLVALGMTVVIMTAGIDLSVGSIVALTSLVAAQTMIEHSIGAALLVGLVVGILCGLINGVFISYVKLQPFLVTLGTMSLYRGLALVYCNGLPIRHIPDKFLTNINALNSLLPIPVIITCAALFSNLKMSLKPVPDRQKV